MAITEEDILSEQSGIDDQTGEWSGVRVLALANSRVEGERPNFSPGFENTWPGEEGIWAACIHNYSVRPFPGRPKQKKVTLLYRKPTRAMILRPGRGMLEIDTASEEKNVVLAVNKTNYSKSLLSGALTPWSTTIFRKGAASQLFSKPVLRVVACERVDKQLEIYDETCKWHGKSNQQAIVDTWPIGSLMFVRGLMRHRPSDCSLLDLVYEFWVDVEEGNPWEFSWQNMYSQNMIDFALGNLESVPKNDWTTIEAPESQTITQGPTDMKRINDFLSWLYTPEA